MTHSHTGSILVRYESALWSVLGAMAYLARDNAGLVYPDILWLFALLLAVSLASAETVRRWPRSDGPHAACTVLSFCVIAAIQSRSGGAQSNLWVLYLLPLFASALLLRGRELALIAAGAALCNAALYIQPESTWGASVLFELAVKTGVLWSAAVSAWVLAEAERRARARVDSQRAQLDSMAAGLRSAESARARDQALAALGMASAATAHDLATPLTVIRGYASLRLEQAELDPGVRKDLERILHAAVFCQSLTAETLSRTGGGESAGKRVDLVAAVENALALSEGILTRRHIAVRCDYEGPALPVRGDAQGLERLFLNLIGNAAKAMPDGGTLTLRLRTDGPEAEARLEDTGRGVPDDVLPRLFSPFVTTRASEGGTGLGLYMCRETARRHGGELSVSNLPQGGASFLLRLPLAAASAAAAS